MWIAALVVVAGLPVAVLFWVIMLWRKSSKEADASILSLVGVIADLDEIYAEVQEANERVVNRNIALKLVNNWHETREQYFADLYHAAHLLTEVFDDRKYGAFLEMGLDTAAGWVPSKPALDMIKLHFSDARDSVLAGRAAIRQLMEWERDNPPPK